MRVTRRPARARPPSAQQQSPSPTQLAKPAWTGDDSLPSKLVNMLIASPLFPLLKIGARQQMQMTAEKNEIPWRKTVSRLEAEQARLEELYDRVRDPTVEYPVGIGLDLELDRRASAHRAPRLDAHTRYALRSFARSTTPCLFTRTTRAT